MLAVIAAALNLADGANKGAQAQYLQGRADAEADIDYTRAKNMGYFAQAGSSANALKTVVIIGVAAVVLSLLIITMKK